MNRIGFIEKETHERELIRQKSRTTLALTKKRRSTFHFDGKKTTDSPNLKKKYELVQNCGAAGAGQKKTMDEIFDWSKEKNSFSNAPPM